MSKSKKENMNDLYYEKTRPKFKKGARVRLNALKAKHLHLFKMIEPGSYELLRESIIERDVLYVVDSCTSCNGAISLGSLKLLDNTWMTVQLNTDEGPITMRVPCECFCSIKQ